MTPPGVRLRARNWLQSERRALPRLLAELGVEGSVICRMTRLSGGFETRSKDQRDIPVGLGHLILLILIIIFIELLLGQSFSLLVPVASTEYHYALLLQLQPKSSQQV